MTHSPIIRKTESNSGMSSIRNVRMNRTPKSFHLLWARLLCGCPCASKISQQHSVGKTLLAAAHQDRFQRPPCRQQTWVSRSKSEPCGSRRCCHLPRSKQQPLGRAAAPCPRGSPHRASQSPKAYYQRLKKSARLSASESESGNETGSKSERDCM